MLVCPREPAAPAPMTRTGKPARESRCAPTAYAVVSGSVAVVVVS